MKTNSVTIKVNYHLKQGMNNVTEYPPHDCFDHWKELHLEAFSLG